MANEENLEVMTSDPVGLQLKRAREQRGLSDSDVARAQHLRPAVIQAIEAGEYGQVDSELFLKGYVRAYARQVGLDDNKIVADLDRELEPLRQKREQEVEANPLVDIERRRRRKRRLAKVILLLGVAALAGYLVFAFVLSESEMTSPSDATEAPAQDESATVGSEQAAPEIENGEPSAPEPQEPATPIVEDPEVAQSEADIGQEPTADPVTDSAADDSASIAPVQTASVAAPATETGIQAPSEPVAMTETGRLEISFRADCWVQVSDADGERLVNSLQRDGDRIDVSGDAPLRVVIGAVTAVDSIRFQNEPVDMGNFRVVNNRSEFTLAN
ncbi:RodZ domain-containing protein [Marinobacter sediminum]|uniref:RodZ domain-containing protein n=1 Tax=Marinobacter sediminum TaxID=256323 RepID=UPI001939D994|nr:RodZ domain-containing protein [Marinobacter sediminum]